MLVLERRVGQAIRIVTDAGEVIVLTVEGFQQMPAHRPSVKLGFDAPKSVTIWRTELLK